MPSVQLQIIRYIKKQKKMIQMKRKISQQTDSEMIQITGLVHKVIKTALIIIFHMFKKAEKSVAIKKRDMKSVKIN